MSIYPDWLLDSDGAIVIAEIRTRFASAPQVTRFNAVPLATTFTVEGQGGIRFTGTPRTTVFNSRPVDTRFE